MFLKIFASHTHAFCSYFQCLEEFMQKQGGFFQNCVFFGISIDRGCFLINRISWIRFFKIQCLTHSKHFFKKNFNFSLSLRPGKAKSSNFCHFPPNLLQGFPLPKPVSPFYPSFCILFHVCMHKFMHFFEIFGLCINWDFCLLKPYFMKLINGFCCYIDIFMIYDG